MRRHIGLEATLVHLTDGSPRNPRFAQAAGFPTPQSYGQARRQELCTALGLIGIDRSQCIQLDLPDQNVHSYGSELVDRLVRILNERCPNLILTPSYEGGHPDHDSAAAAIHLAKKIARASCRHFEYRLYHRGTNGGWETQRFLSHENTIYATLPFTPDEQRLKEKLRMAFRTQREVLGRFHFRDEAFRTAPTYDFSKRPHDGTLLYEEFDWNVSWDDWARAWASMLTSFDGSKPR